MFKVNWADITERALKTFAQAFLATVIAGLTVVEDWNGAKALFIAAVASGISAVWNWLKETA